METKFNKGDLVPEWVLRAPEQELQGEASFGADVVVTHGPNNSPPVSVRPYRELKEDEYLCRITEAGNSGDWEGAPTTWYCA